ncbi:MAG: helix-turn-helix transcriptional regulator [Acidimicrobiales bacterium]
MTRPGVTKPKGPAPAPSRPPSVQGLAREGPGARRHRGQASGGDAFTRYERALTAIMVGSAVRVARHRAGLSQAELAKRARTSQPSIARLEQGRVSPTIISLDRIARALDSELVVDFEPLAAPQGR